MSKTDSLEFSSGRFAAERRRFLAEGALYGAGAVSILAELGLAGCVTPKQTSSAPPAPTPLRIRPQRQVVPHRHAP